MSTVQAGTPYRFVTYGLLLAANFSVSVAFLGPASLLPLIIEDMEISRAAAGLLVTSMTLVVTLLSIPVGVVAPRWGLRRTYTVGLYLQGVAVLAPLAPGFAGLLGLRLVQGLGAAIVLTLMPSVIMRWARLREVPVFNAVNLIAATGGIGAGMVLGPPLAEGMGWARTLGAEGALILVSATLWLLWAREGPGQGATSQTAAGVGEIARVFRLRATWLLAIGVIGPWAQFATLTSWLPSYYSEGRGLSLSVASFTTAVFTSPASRRRPWVACGPCGWGSAAPSCWCRACCWGSGESPPSWPPRASLSIWPS